MFTSLKSRFRTVIIMLVVAQIAFNEEVNRARSELFLRMKKTLSTAEETKLSFTTSSIRIA